MGRARAERYDVFLSFGHAADGALAPVLQSELQRYAKPWYRARGMRVFRDDANLAAEARLWAAIENALAASAWFVLLASPEAAESVWVDREVAWWLDHRSPDRLLVVLTSGELPTSLPPSLRDAGLDEPRWIDLREPDAVDAPDRSDPRLRECVVDVAATVRGIPKDHLVGEHLRQYRRTLRWAGAAVTTLSLLLVAALVASVVAFQERDRAVAGQRATAARTMLGRADQVRDSDPAAALRLGLAAAYLQPGPASRASLVETVSTSPFRGVIDGLSLSVESTAWSPDGHTLAAASGRGDVLLWDTSSSADRRRPPRTIAHRQFAATALAFSPDGRTLASASAAEGVSLWDLTGRTPPVTFGQMPRVSPGIAGDFRDRESLSFSPDGHLLAVGSDRSTVSSTVLWDVTDRAGPRALPPLPVPGGARRVVFSPLGHVLVVASGPQGYALWDVGDPVRPRPLATLTDRAAPGANMALSPDGRTLLVPDTAPAAAALWDVSDPAHAHPLGAPFGPILLFRAPAMSTDGRTLASGSTDNTVTLWDAGDPAAVRVHTPLRGHQAYAGELAVSRNDVLASGGQDNRLLLWSIHGDDDARRGAALPSGSSGTGTGLPGTWSSDGRTLALWSESGSAELWDVGDPTQFRELGRIPATSAAYVALSSDGRRAAVLDRVPGPDDYVSIETRAITLWDITETGAPRQVGSIPVDPNTNPRSAAFSPRGDVLAVASVADVGLWSITDPAHPRQLVDQYHHVDGSDSAAFSADGMTLAVGDLGGAQLWNVRDPAAPVKVSAPRSAGVVFPDHVTFSPDGRVLAAASNRVALWNVDAPTGPLNASSPINPASALSDPAAVSADTKTVAVVPPGEAGVDLWDTSDPAVPRPLGLPVPVGDRTPLGVSLSPDGRVLAVADYADVTLWDLEPLRRLRSDPVTAACARAGPLSPSDWNDLAPGLPYEDTCAGR